MDPGPVSFTRKQTQKTQPNNQVYSSQLFIITTVSFPDPFSLHFLSRLLLPKRQCRQLCKTEDVRGQQKMCPYLSFPISLWHVSTNLLSPLILLTMQDCDQCWPRHCACWGLCLPCHKHISLPQRAGHISGSCSWGLDICCRSELSSELLASFCAVWS